MAWQRENGGVGAAFVAPFPMVVTPHDGASVGSAMRLRDLPFWLFLLLVAGGCQSDEPTHDGKPLGYWVRRAGQAHRNLLDMHNPLRADLEAFEALEQIGAESVPHLVSMVETSEARVVRIRALGALVTIGPDAPGVITALIDALDSSDWHVRWMSAAALGKVGVRAADAVPALRRLILSEGSLPCQKACAALAAIGPAARAAVPDLITLLEQIDAEEMDRISAINALVSIGETRATVPAFEALLDDLEGRTDGDASLLRSVASRALEQLDARRFESRGLRDRTRTLVSRLATGSERDRWQALLAVGRLGRGAVPVLRSSLEKEGPESGELTVVALALAEAQARDAPSADEATRAEVAERTERALETILARLRTTTDIDQWNARDALGLLAPAAVPQLTALLRDGDDVVRAAAATALGGAWSPLADDATADPASNSAAIDAAAIALADALEDREDLVRMAAVVALRTLGPRARAALPALQEKLASRDAGVSSAARHVLEVLDEPGTRPPPAEDQ